MSANIPKRISFNIDTKKLKEIGKKSWDLLVLYSQAVKENEKLKTGKKKHFTKKTRDLKLAQVNNHCEKCGKYSEFLELHHKYGRADNSLENCEALCPDCHAKKHRKPKSS